DLVVRTDISAAEHRAGVFEGMTGESPLRVAVIYEGSVAPAHGGRRILEQMAWLVAEGCDVSLLPVNRTGEPMPELSPEIGRLGIRLIEPLRVHRRSRLVRLFPNVHQPCVNLVHVEQVGRASDWAIVGNTTLAGSAELTRAVRGGQNVVSWDGDSL